MGMIFVELCYLLCNVLLWGERTYHVIFRDLSAFPGADNGGDIQRSLLGHGLREGSHFGPALRRLMISGNVVFFNATFGPGALDQR